jgi:hypothetical protein
MISEKNCNENFLVEFIDYTTDVIEKLTNMDLLLHKSQSGLYLVQTIDILTLFGLFNVYDVNALSNILTKSTSLKHEKAINKLIFLNAKGFDLIKNRYNDYNKFDQYSLILYNLSLLNLNIENTDAISALFKHVSSVKEMQEISPQSANEVCAHFELWK